MVNRINGLTQYTLHVGQMQVKTEDGFRTLFREFSQELPAATHFALPGGVLPGQWLETAVHFDNSVSLRYNYGDTNQIVLEPLRYDQAPDAKGDRL